MSMLKANIVIRGINLGSREVRRALQAGGYPTDKVDERKFIGINGTQFVYSINYPDDDAHKGVGNALVYVEWDEAQQKFIADY